jgi:hypothetical protein
MEGGSLHYPLEKASSAVSRVGRDVEEERGLFRPVGRVQWHIAVRLCGHDLVLPECDDGTTGHTIVDRPSEVRADLPIVPVHRAVECLE